MVVDSVVLSWLMNAGSQRAFAPRGMAPGVRAAGSTFPECG
jgi:hypothetical protein